MGHKGVELSDEYTDDEWREAVVGRPLADLSDERFMTLHRHWIWANSALRWFEGELALPETKTPDEIDLTSARAFSMFLWYSLLWSVIEGVQKDRVTLRGEFRTDLRGIREPLRKARNAVMHVSQDGYYDRRLFEIMAAPDSASKIRRVHKGFARLFLVELRERQQPEPPEPA
jgi:hypothetical protein